LDDAGEFYGPVLGDERVAVVYLEARWRQAQVSHRLYAQVFASHLFPGSLGRAKSEDPARFLTALLSGPN
jgi:hypothetical protein